MEIRQLRTFQTIVETGNFTQTAKLLGYTQSAVSAQMKSLEQELGAPLWDYRHRQLTLTDAGTRLVPLARQLLADYQAVQDLTRPQQLRGTLHLAAPESLTIYRLPPILTAFRQAYPDVKLVLTNATCRYNQAQLIAGTADVAWMMWPSLTSTGLTDTDFGEQAVVGVVSPQFSGEFADLKGLPFIINEPDCSYRNQFERQIWGDWHWRPQIMELWSIAAIKTLVASGVGFSYLPRLAVQAELDAGQLREVATPITNEIHAHMLTRKSNQNPLVSAFVEIAKKNWDVKKS